MVVKLWYTLNLSTLFATQWLRDFLNGLNRKILGVRHLFRRVLDESFLSVLNRVAIPSLN